jgi:hypothetical protein
MTVGLVLASRGGISGAWLTQRFAHELANAGVVKYSS